MMYRPNMARPLPPDFERVFVTMGWRGVERTFRSRAEVNQRWLNQAGRDRLLAARRAYLRGPSVAAPQAAE